MLFLLISEMSAVRSSNKFQPKESKQLFMLVRIFRTSGWIQMKGKCCVLGKNRLIIWIVINYLANIPFLLISNNFFALSKSHFQPRYSKLTLTPSAHFSMCNILRVHNIASKNFQAEKNSTKDERQLFQDQNRVILI